MNTFKVIMAAGAAAVMLASTAQAAVFAKYDGVDGEAQSAEWGENELWLTTDEEPVAIGLLLPAVQKVREAASTSESQTRAINKSTPLIFEAGRAKSFENFEITDGDVEYTLYNARAYPTSDENRVRIAFRCKDWTNTRTGETGSDCPQRATLSVPSAAKDRQRSRGDTTLND